MTATAEQVSPRLMDHEEYRAAFDRLQRCRAEKSRILARLDVLNGHLAAPTNERNGQRNDEAAEQFLATGKLAATVGAQAAAREEAGELYAQLRVLTRAVELAEQKLSLVRADVSKRIAEAMKPEYVALLQRLAIAAHEAATIADEERAFRAALTENQVSFTGTFTACPLNEGFSVASEWSWLNLWFAEISKRFPGEIDFRS